MRESIGLVVRGIMKSHGCARISHRLVGRSRGTDFVMLIVVLLERCLKIDPEVIGPLSVEYWKNCLIES